MVFLILIFFGGDFFGEWSGVSSVRHLLGRDYFVKVSNKGFGDSNYVTSVVDGCVIKAKDVVLKSSPGIKDYLRVGVPDFLLFNCVSGVAGDFCFLEVKKFRDGLRFEQFEWFRNFHGFFDSYILWG